MTKKTPRTSRGRRTQRRAAERTAENQKHRELMELQRSFRLKKRSA